MKQLLTIAVLCAGLMFAFGLNHQAVAQQQEIDNPDIRVGVDGLACPFCAYGIEKKLKKIENIEDLYVNLEDGTVDLALKKETTLSEERIKEAVKEAGFEVRNIEYVNEAAKPKTKTPPK